MIAAAGEEGEALRLALGIGFVLWCIFWVLEIGFLLDRWMWWRKERGDNGGGGDRGCGWGSEEGEEYCALCLKEQGKDHHGPPPTAPNR